MNYYKMMVLGILTLSHFIIALADDNISQTAQCRRLVSLAPSITQTLDYLDLSSNLVGITRYCQRPSSATNVKEVGGLLDMNLEAIYALKPSLILNSVTQSSNSARLQELKIATLSLKYNSLQGIFESINQIGQTCEITAHTDLKLQEFKSNLDKYANLIKIFKNKIKHKPKILLLYGFSQKNDSQTLMAAGVSYHNDLLNYLGLENAYSGKQNAPQLSSEALLTLSADIIIYLENITNPDEHKYLIYDQDKKLSAKFYEKLTTINHVMMNKTTAAKNQQVYRINGRFTVIPAPLSIVQLADNLTAIVEGYINETSP